MYFATLHACPSHNAESRRSRNRHLVLLESGLTRNAGGSGVLEQGVPSSNSRRLGAEAGFADVPDVEWRDVPPWKRQRARARWSERPLGLGLWVVEESDPAESRKSKEGGS